MTDRDPRSRWPRRPVAALLLALALGAARTPAAEPAPPRDPLTARVNGYELRLSEVHASIDSLNLGDQIDARDQLDTYIEAMVNEEVLFQWALAEDFAGDEDLRRAVKDLVVRHLIDTHVRSRIRVSEADARAYYDANPGLVRGEHVRVRRILLADRARCEEMARQISSEADFIAAARRFSLDASTREQGGDLGPLLRAERPQQGSDEEQLFDMKQGETRIFDVPQGCLLVRSVYHVNPPLPPFAAVREQIVQFLRKREELRLVDRLFKRAAAAVKIERFYGSARSKAALQRGGEGGPGGTSR